MKIYLTPEASRKLVTLRQTHKSVNVKLFMWQCIREEGVITNPGTLQRALANSLAWRKHADLIALPVNLNPEVAFIMEQQKDYIKANPKSLRLPKGVKLTQELVLNLHVYLIVADHE